MAQEEESRRIKFMPQSNQECMARRCQSSDTKNVVQRYNAGYDCELPLEIRTELIAPRRPRILGAPAIIRERSNRRPWQETSIWGTRHSEITPSPPKHTHWTTLLKASLFLVAT